MLNHKFVGNMFLLFNEISTHKIAEGNNPRRTLIVRILQHFSKPGYAGAGSALLRTSVTEALTHVK